MNLQALFSRDQVYYYVRLILLLFFYPHGVDLMWCMNLPQINIPFLLSSPVKLNQLIVPVFRDFILKIQTSNAHFAKNLKLDPCLKIFQLIILPHV